MKLKIFTRKNLSFLLITGVLIVAGISHGWNMFHFPYYENDEGTYMSQAWSLLTAGKLAPYTYWYDHAPGGWFFIALWTMLTGGFFTFGVSVNSGRVLMLVIHLLSTLLLLLISKRLTGRYWAGVIAAVFFSFSPLAIYFQRRVLLDNMMIFWILLSMWLLLKEKFTLLNVYLSSVAFGIAVLTKENAIFFLPAFLYLIYQKAHTFHRSFAILKWLFISVSIMSLYVVYALLKSELFPQGFFGETLPHVSLLGTLEEHSVRGSSLPFWNPLSDFYLSFQSWIHRDPYIVYGGIAAFVLGLLGSIKEKSLRVPLLMAGFGALFLLRGKLVIEFYVVPMIPLFALLIGMVVDALSRMLSFKKNYMYTFLMLLATLASSFLFLRNPQDAYTQDDTSPQVKTITWIKENLPETTRIAIDDYMYVDLHDRKTPDERMYPYAEWVWKIEKDPEVLNRSFRNDWKNIEYITLSHEMLKQIKDRNFILLRYALDNSDQVVDFSTLSSSPHDSKTYSSTNGDWMSIYKVTSTDKIMLTSSWNFFKKTYIHSYGQVINPESGVTTSSDQANAMLRAAWVGDRAAFDGIWAWTKDHFQHRGDDALLSRAWKGKTLLESDTDAAADQDIALALLVAYKTWGAPSYRKDALKLIQDIWKHEIKKVGGSYALVSGTGSNSKLRTDALSPATYKVFAQFDTDHPWEEVADDSYTVLTTKKPETAPYPACFTTNSRLALDAIWFTDQRSLEMLSETQVSSASAREKTAVLSITDRTKAEQIYAQQFEKSFNFDQGYWKNKHDFQLQNCAWITTIVNKNILPTFSY